MKMASRLWLLSSLATLAVFVAALSLDFTSPWVQNDDYNGAFWSQAAHNFLRAGWRTSAGVPAPLYFGPLPIPAQDFYVHHPTLLPAVVTGTLAIFGEREWAARLVPIVCSVLTAAGLWLLVRRASGMRAASLTLAMFVALPMQLHYGRMVNFEALQMVWMVGAFLCLNQWRANSSRWWAAGFSLCLLLGMWTDWLGYLLALILAAKFLLDRKERKLAFLLLALMTFAGCSFLIQLRCANSSAWNELIRAFQMRVSHGGVDGKTVTWPDWGRTVGGYLMTFYLPASWVLALAGTGLALWRRRNWPNCAPQLLEASACLFLMNACYVLGLRNQSFVHDFASFYFSLPVAIMAGFCLETALIAASKWSPLQRAMATILVLAVASGMVATGVRRLNGIDSPFTMLDGTIEEPTQLMPALGRAIRDNAPPGTTVLCNFDEYNSPLAYYAQRPLATGLTSVEQLNEAAQEETGPVAELFWLNDPAAAKIVSSLPPGRKMNLTIAGIPFCLWTPEAQVSAAMAK